MNHKVFYMSRHGQSEYNLVGRIGGDSGLTKDGDAYARKLAEYAEETITKDSQGNEVSLTTDENDSYHSL